MMHPDDVRWAVLRVQADALAGRPFQVYPHTPAAQALADELLALPVDELLAHCSAVRAKHEEPDAR